MSRIVIGNLRTLPRSSLPPGVRIPPPGQPRRRSRGRYVMDSTGAIKFEHDIGPDASLAVTKLEHASSNLQTAIESLRKPAVQMLTVAVGAAVVTLAIAGVVYYMTRPEKKKRRRR